MSHVTRFGMLLAILALLVAPSLALACPVCIDPSGASRSAYFNTTILLSLVPLGFIFGCGMVIRARLKAQDDELEIGGQPGVSLRQENS